MTINHTHPLPQWWQRLRRRLGPDRGATTIETVSYCALWLSTPLVGVQAAMGGRARRAHLCAVQHRMQATPVAGGSAAQPGHGSSTTGVAGPNRLSAPEADETERCRHNGHHLASAGAVP